MTTTAPTQAMTPTSVRNPERAALLGGVAFLDLAAPATSIDLPVMTGWVEQHLVRTGAMLRPAVLLEPPVRSVALWPAETPTASERVDLLRLVDTARHRVIHELQAFVGRPSEDRFLRAAIFLGRVRRDRGRWVARPEATAPLSGMVLSLFAVGILSDRATFERELCVCDRCGRVSFDARPFMRSSCPLHPSRSQSGSMASVRLGSIAPVARQGTGR